jgi:hypothetical protein
MQRKTTEDYIGTCQACFGEFKVGADKLMVLHGYQRPGDGYTHGNCAGYDHKPFEYEHTLTDKIIADLHEQIAKDVEYLRALKAGEVIKLFRMEKQYDANHRPAGDKLVEYTPQDRKWSQVLNSKISNVEADIRWNNGLVSHFQFRVDNWKLGTIVGIDTPVTGRERGLAKAYDPLEAAAAEERAKIKAARDAKPGKLSIIFYQPSEPRPGTYEEIGEAGWRKWIENRDAKAKAFADEIRTWAKANIDGKTLVRPQVGDYDLPRNIRGTGDFDVVIVNLPWEYRGEITHMFSSATIYNNEPKKVSYVLAGGPRPH